MWRPKDPYLDGANASRLEGMMNSAIGLYTGNKRNDALMDKDSAVSMETIRAHVGPREQRPWTQATVWTRPIALHAWVIAGQGSLVNASDTEEPWCFKAPEPNWALHEFESIPKTVVERVPWPN